MLKFLDLLCFCAVVQELQQNFERSKSERRPKKKSGKAVTRGQLLLINGATILETVEYVCMCMTNDYRTTNLLPFL